MEQQAQEAWIGKSAGYGRVNNGFGVWRVVAAASASKRLLSRAKNWMTMTDVIEASLPKGSCPIHVFGDTEAARATVILFMDAFGPRPALFRIAEALAGTDRRVIVPDLFYAHLPYRPLSPASLFSGGEDRARLHEMVGDLDQARIDKDIAALLDFVGERFGAGQPLAAVGYCLGGRYALSAASLSSQVRFAASIHGSQLAPVAADGLHKRFAHVPGTVYVGIAEQDPTFDAAEEGRLAEALRAGKVAHLIESYPGAAHGFALQDLPVYNERAATHHLRRLEEFLAQAAA